jgi:hypothetical protein
MAVGNVGQTGNESPPLEVDSILGQGTKVRVKIPMDLKLS